MKSRTIENPVIGDRVTFVRTSGETGGEVTELLVELAPGGGNELHYHTSFTESFTPLDGQLGVQIGMDRRLIDPGETATVPPGVVHRFFNAADRPVRFKGEARPGTLGSEQFVQIAYGLARDGLVNRRGLPRNLTHIALLMEMGDMRAPGIMFRVLRPLLGWLARRGRERGVERQLIERYCT